MQLLNKNTEQLSGLVDIYVVPTINIKKIENQFMTCYTQDNIFRFMAANESISHQDILEQNQAGQLRKSKLSFLLPGQSYTTDKILNKISVYKFVVVIRDQDGLYNIIGDLEHNLSMDFEYANSANWSGSKGYTIQFSGELINRMKPINFPFMFI